jgi:hypothetical protein
MPLHFCADVPEQQGPDRGEAGRPRRSPCRTIPRPRRRRRSRNSETERGATWASGSAWDRGRGHGVRHRGRRLPRLLGGRHRRSEIGLPVPFQPRARRSGLVLAEDDAARRARDARIARRRPRRPRGDGPPRAGGRLVVGPRIDAPPLSGEGEGRVRGPLARDGLGDRETARQARQTVRHRDDAGPALRDGHRPVGVDDRSLPLPGAVGHGRQLVLGDRARGTRWDVEGTGGLAERRRPVAPGRLLPVQGARVAALHDNVLGPVGRVAPLVLVDRDRRGARRRVHPLDAVAASRGVVGARGRPVLAVEVVDEGAVRSAVRHVRRGGVRRRVPGGDVEHGRPRHSRRKTRPSPASMPRRYRRFRAHSP